MKQMGSIMIEVPKTLYSKECEEFGTPEREQQAYGTMGFVQTNDVRHNPCQEKRQVKNSVNFLSNGMSSID